MNLKKQQQQYDLTEHRSGECDVGVDGFKDGPGAWVEPQKLRWQKHVTWEYLFISLFLSFLFMKT